MQSRVIEYFPLFKLKVLKLDRIVSGDPNDEEGNLKSINKMYKHFA